MYFDSKINLEIQLKAILNDLKLEQDNLAQHVKEKDKVLRKLKSDELLVAQIQGHIPGLLNERESLQHEVHINLRLQCAYIENYIIPREIHK